MTIEFHCPFCQKLLKTAEDKAGVSAKCPGCGQTVTVPAVRSEPKEAQAPTAGEGNARFEPRENTYSGSAAIEEEAGQSSETMACPMCEAQIKKSATRCRFCGESLVDRRPEGVPQQIEAGDVLSNTWDIFKNQLGLLVGSFVMLIAVYFGLSIAGQAAQFAVLFGAGGLQAPNNPNFDSLSIAVAVIVGLVYFATTCFFEGGYHVLLLKIARGERAEITDMFSGARFFWRIFFANLLFTLMVYVGLVLLIVPGIIVSLMFWPFMYVIVDRDVGIIESFRRSRELTSGNYVASIVLGLAAAGAYLAGLFACCVGVIFSMPFALFTFAVAYCAMSGQAVAVSRRR